MLLQIPLFVLGLGVLYYGAEWLVRGAASIALRYGIRPLVVGLTVVALGTSMPEFVINFFAAVDGQDALALGNIVGSNICNIALILGTSAVIVPMAVGKDTLRKEYPLMMGTMALFYALAFDGVVTQFDGLVLVAGLIAFLLFIVVDARRQARGKRLDAELAHPPEDLVSPRKKVLLLVGGMIFLAVGAHLMVDAAVKIAGYLGINHVIVGLTVVALGTSLPELAASVVSALKDDSAMSIGNVLGSNLLNVLFVVGLVSMISPLNVDTESIHVHFPVMLGFGGLLLPLAWTEHRITRFEGVLLLVGFLIYIGFLVTPHL